jgi:biuret amidohydrolase
MQHHRNLGIPDTLADACDAECMALPVYDMQVGVGQLPDGPQVTQRVARVLDAARGALVRVFFIRFMTLPPEPMGVFQLRRWPGSARIESRTSSRRFCATPPGSRLCPSSPRLHRR